MAYPLQSNTFQVLQPIHDLDYTTFIWTNSNIDDDVTMHSSTHQQ